MNELKIYYINNYFKRDHNMEETGGKKFRGGKSKTYLLGTFTGYPLKPPLRQTAPGSVASALSAGR